MPAPTYIGYSSHYLAITVLDTALIYSTIYSLGYSTAIPYIPLHSHSPIKHRVAHYTLYDIAHYC